MDLLAKYSELQLQRLTLDEQINDLSVAIAAKVEKAGPMSGYGFKAHWKPGRKRVDHEAAAKAVEVPEEIVAMHTTIPAPRVAWAKVTKEYGVPKIVLDEYTTEGDPTFAIDILK